MTTCVGVTPISFVSYLPIYQPSRVVTTYIPHVQYCVNVSPTSLITRNLNIESTPNLALIGCSEVWGQTGFSPSHTMCSDYLANTPAKHALKLN